MSVWALGSWYFWSNFSTWIYQLPEDQSFTASCLLAILCSMLSLSAMELSCQNSTRFMSQSSRKVDRPAVLWSNSIGSLRDTQKAFIKARVVTGCYRLQVHVAMQKQNQHTTSANCVLCSEGVEDRAHFLLSCRSLESVRQPHMLELEKVLQSEQMEKVLNDKEWLLQVVIDPTHECLAECVSKYVMNECERISRNMVYALHVQRVRMLDEWHAAHDDGGARYVRPSRRKEVQKKPTKTKPKKEPQKVKRSRGGVKVGHKPIANRSVKNKGQKRNYNKETRISAQSIGYY